MSGGFFDELQSNQEKKYKKNEKYQKTSDKKTYTLRLTANIHNQAKSQAAAKGISFSDYVEQLIEADL